MGLPCQKNVMQLKLIFNFKPEILHLAEAIELNALAQGAFWKFTQWLWLKQPIFN